ncbi:MAG TPA: DUF134 domain-containing protein [Candidatus Anoxymicrobiaceae bacterium]
MARPAKPRFVTGEPCVDFFKPRGIPLRELEKECLSVEELEALKLADIECLYQEDAAERMEVSRPTFQRVLKSARGKVARCLVQGKALGIEGGNYVLAGEGKTFECLSCEHSWEEPFGSGVRACETVCPKCGQMTVRRACARRPRMNSSQGPGGCCASQVARVRKGSAVAGSAEDVEEKRK